MFCFVLCSFSFHKFSFKHLGTEANFLSLPDSIIARSLESSARHTPGKTGFCPVLPKPEAWGSLHAHHGP